MWQLWLGSSSNPYGDKLMILHPDGNCHYLAVRRCGGTYGSVDITVSHFSSNIYQICKYLKLEICAVVMQALWCVLGTACKDL